MEALDLSEMSKAFTKEEDDAAPVDEPLPPRPRDPSPITARGLRALRDEHQALVDAGLGHERRARIVKSILDTVREKPATDVGSDAGFGCAVVVECEQLCLLLGEDRRGDERVMTTAFSGCFEGSDADAVAARAEVLRTLELPRSI